MYAVRPVMEKNIMIYCGTRNMGKSSAEPVPLYTCVIYTCVVAVGRQEKNLDRD